MALVKVISFDDYLETAVTGFEERVPYSMTAEIIKNYKGELSGKTIRIFGDNGMLCRPYLSVFEVNGYYLVAPNLIENEIGNKYDFFSCRTDYLKVDIATNRALGNYSMCRSEIDLVTFENQLEKGDWNIVTSGLLFGILVLFIVVVRRYK